MMVSCRGKEGFSGLTKKTQQNSDLRETRFGIGIVQGCSARGSQCRRGIILPVMLLLFALLSMAALGFAFTVRADYMAQRTREKMMQARMAAMSGLEAGALALRVKFADSAYWSDNAALFFDHSIEQNMATNTQVSPTSWRYSLVATNFDNQDVPRFGCTDEASRVNINVASPDQLRRLISKVAPTGSVETLVQCILDWRESGTSPRALGAKDVYYERLDEPYRCKKAPFDSLEELLLVKGVDGTLIFGEDMNRNGLLDANENDGETSMPLDNGDGIMDRGLAPYITVYSREPEVCDSNAFMPRVNITMLPDGARGKVRDEIIDFIKKAIKAKAKFGKSPASLLGMTVKSGDTTLTSPVTLEDMPAVMDCLTTGYHVYKDGFVYGRININTASRTVLQTIGKLSEEEIDLILKVRSQLDAERKKTIAWLVTEKALSEEQFKEVAHLFTARSYQFTMESIGYNDYDGLQCRLQAVLELRLPRVQYVYFRDLSEFGRCYNFKKLKEGNTVVQQNVSAGR